jgi:hypothetical protein
LVRVESVQPNASAQASPTERVANVLGQDGLGKGWLTAAFLLASLAIVSRCPSLFLHAKFYAEDGRDWFAQAYNFGWLHSLTLPYMGYLTMVERLGGLAVFVPFQRAPLIMALVGLIFQAAPVPLLLSSQLRRWAPLSARMAFAAAYVAIPNQREIHVVLTNSQWHLAMLLGLIAFAEVPKGVATEILELALVLLGALSGPFGVVLMPLVAVFWYVRRQRWTALVFAVLSAGAILQFFVLLKNYSQRPTGTIGASVSLFIRLLGGNCFIGALLGSRHPFGLALPLAYSACMLVIGISLCVYCARFLSAEVRLFFMFCFLIFLAEIRVPSKVPLWHALLPLVGQRYMFFPSLPLLFAILWCAGYARSRAVRATGVALTLVLCIGICADWRLPAMPTIDLNQQAATLRAARPGEQVVLPIDPPGWDMTLIKR